MLRRRRWALRAAEDKIAARVEGTETYQVELGDGDGNLAYDCTCPRAADGYFCKHCVAGRIGVARREFCCAEIWRQIRQEEAA